MPVGVTGHPRNHLCPEFQPARSKIPGCTFYLAKGQYLFYNLLYFAVFRDVAAGIFTSLKPTTLYGNGTWFHFVKPTFQQAGFLPVVLTLFAISAILRLKAKGLFFVLYFSYCLIHTIIYRFGLFASGGYTLFLMPLAPGIALASAIGMESILNWISGQKGILPAQVNLGILKAVLVVSLCVGMFIFGFRSKPHSLAPEEKALADAAHYLKSKGVEANRVYSAHVYMVYLYDLPLLTNNLYHPDPASIQEGEYVIWDQHYSDRWGIRYSELEDPASNFKLVESFYDGQVVLFQKESNP
jgi:hypothetical protein